MQTKKLAGVILSVSLLLVGCSSGNQAVATMKGKTITQEDYYKALKESQAGKSTLQNLILTDALEQKYNDKVKKSEIDAEYKKLEDQYKGSLPAMLKQAGYTESSYKKSIKSRLLAKAALKDKQPESSKKFKDALDSAWKSYSPKISVQSIQVDDENTAKDLIKKYEEDPTEANFSKLAKENSKDTSSKDNGGKLAEFDPKSTTNQQANLDTNLKEAAGKLKKQGDYTKEPVKGSTSGFYIIRLIKTPNKGKFADHKKELTEQIYNQWQSDATVMNPIYGKVLKEVDTKIVDKDKDLKDVLSSFYQTQTPTTQQNSNK
ncbi:peptidylprolyl isomerase [Xylocopilactobacillus apicola]|uniref:Foldase protein PrsA n=1 Tax=Xylocopilactobacillus apicola TaxID=2932184 RepID=A0AAU9D1B7_9LACO|nr:peptidylprolyl isomerase [Xylocopilactobacillus apicola]BDR58506.1 foldase protein PrsA [Xylocopilactobacillus apicola]